VHTKELIALCSEHGIYLTKKRGQNFLVDSNIIESVLKKSSLVRGDNVLEIGTGLGALTELLLSRDCQVVSYEIDKKIYAVVNERLKHHSKLKLLHADFLKSDFQGQFKKPFRVVANIPYKIASQILMNLWFAKENIQDIMVLVQKEYGDRLLAPAGSRQTGLLSVCMQTDFNLRVVRKVSRKVFFPEPNVDSVFLSLVPRLPGLKAKHRIPFHTLLKTSFHERRKKLLPKLKARYPGAVEAFQTLQLQDNLRAEEIDLATWMDIFYALIDHKI